MDTEALTCGWCHMPLDPRGVSLYFCAPKNRSGNGSECQQAWMARQIDGATAYKPARWEEFAPVKPGG